jgi:hypothetical protein
MGCNKQECKQNHLVLNAFLMAAYHLFVEKKPKFVSLSSIIMLKKSRFF